MGFSLFFSADDLDNEYVRDSFVCALVDVRVLARIQTRTDVRALLRVCSCVRCAGWASVFGASPSGVLAVLHKQKELWELFCRICTGSTSAAH